MTPKHANSLTYLFDRSADQGRLELTDLHRLDLLHRMSTNDMNSLAMGHGCSTVLTTALARIIDRLIVYNRGETVLALANYPDVVRGWLQKHIFFQDKVRLRDVSAELVQLELYGPEAAQIAGTFAAGVNQLGLHDFIDATTAHGQMLIARTYALAGNGFIIIIATSALESVKTSITKWAGVSLGTSADYEMLRISAGLPGKGHELTEDFIPLEANLWDSVSFSKGCYIGQEIIARMESRNRLAKTLVALHIEGHAAEGNTLTDGERNIGTVTSLAPQPDGSMIGLAFVKPEQAAPGTRLMVKPFVPPSNDEPGNGASQHNQALIQVEVTTSLLSR